MYETNRLEMCTLSDYSKIMIHVHVHVKSDTADYEIQRVYATFYNAIGYFLHLPASFTWYLYGRLSDLIQYLKLTTVLR